MIAIIDYGMGNLHSVEKAFVAVGAEVRVTDDPDVIASADKVVLPGVGAFGDCMANLRRRGLESVIQEALVSGRPFLGICLGLQLLFEGSEEAPGVPGLGFFAGQVEKIKAPDLKIPHMGWNSLEVRRTSPLFEPKEAERYVYFVHSYHAVPADDSIITAVADYGGPITAAVGRNAVQAVQFHPEKSSTVGLAMLRAFKEMNV